MSLLKLYGKLLRGGGGITAPPLNLFIQHGNSLGVGYLNGSDITTTEGIGNVVYNGLVAEGGMWEYGNTAQGGANISSDIARLSNCSALFEVFYEKIIIAEIEGTNTIATGATGEAAYDEMMDFVADALDLDPRVCVLLYMCPNTRPDFTDETERGIYNDLLAGTTQTSRFKIVNIQSEPIVNAMDAHENLTYYSADEVHMKVPGYAVLGGLGLTKALEF